MGMETEFLDIDKIGNPNYYQMAKELALENFEMRKKIAANEEALKVCMDGDLQAMDSFTYIMGQKQTLRAALANAVAMADTARKYLLEKPSNKTKCNIELLRLVQMYANQQSI